MDPEFLDLVYVYHKGKILDEIYGSGIYLCLRMFPYMSNTNHKINWANSKRLIYGSLIVMTNPDLKEFIFAVVHSQNDKKGKNQKKVENEGCVDVFIRGVGDEHLSLLDVCSKLDINNLVVLECKAYFESYYHFLKTLQAMHDKPLPFVNQIIYNNFKENLYPSYLKNHCFRINEKILKKITTETLLNFSDPPADNPIQKMLDESQYNSLKNILLNEFSIIQGPPGFFLW